MGITPSSRIIALAHDIGADFKGLPLSAHRAFEYPSVVRANRGGAGLSWLWSHRVGVSIACVLAGAPPLVASCSSGGSSTGSGVEAAADGTVEAGVPADSSSGDVASDVPSEGAGADAGAEVGPDAGADVLAVADASIGISAGGFHSCFMSGGTAKCWGANFFGDLGNGTHGAVPSPTPTTVIGITGGVAHGAWHACGFAGTQVNCWGANSDDELGHDQGRELDAGVGGDASDATAGVWFSRPSTSAPSPVAGASGAVTLSLGYEGTPGRFRTMEPSAAGGPI